MCCPASHPWAIAPCNRELLARGGQESRAFGFSRMASHRAAPPHFHLQHIAIGFGTHALRRSSPLGHAKLLPRPLETGKHVRTAGGGPAHPCCRRSQALRAAGWSAAAVRPGPRATSLLARLQGPRHDRCRHTPDLRGAPSGSRRRPEVRGLRGRGRDGPATRVSTRCCAAAAPLGATIQATLALLGLSEGRGMLGAHPAPWLLRPARSRLQRAPASLSGTLSLSMRALPAGMAPLRLRFPPAGNPTGGGCCEIPRTLPRDCAGL